MSEHRTRRWTDTRTITSAAACASLIAFCIYLRSGDLLLYGDAIAHMYIARRVFDSRTPGLLQLGTVWLPLPHVLLMPFVSTVQLWHTGAAASIPSMLAYVAACVGIFRLTRAVLSGTALSETTTRVTAFAAAALFALNPNLLYMQAIAMSESLYLALFIWALVFFQEFLRDSRSLLHDLTPPAHRALFRCFLCVAAACLTRYDGWFLAATIGAILFALWLRDADHRRVAFPMLARSALALSAAPLFWIAYNTAVYRNPIEFANGPYSAKAIERKSGSATHPGAGNPALAARYFVRAAELNVAEPRTAPLLFVIAIVGAFFLVLSRGTLDTTALLWSPLAFYALSVAYSGVPIYLPDWPPFGAYNVRYGLQLLPAIVVFLPVAIAFLSASLNRPAFRNVLVAAVSALLVLTYVSVWRATPICYREAWINSRSRLDLESQLATQLTRLPAGSGFLMYLGSHVGALQQASIPLRRAVSEGNHRVWVQPSDPEGLWERALANPSRYVDYVVAIDGDPVADALRSTSLPVVTRITVDGQPPATLYRAR
jgi:hypothetical protein